MEKNPDEWPEVIAPGAFDGIDQDVPLTLGIGGPVIGIAHAKGVLEGLSVTTTIRPSNDEVLPVDGMSFKFVPPEEG